MAKLQASLVLEILGRPAENVKESLNTIVVKLGSEKGVRILEKKYHEPKAVEDSKDLFTAFAEIDVEFEAVGNFFGIIFSYFPSHIEIIHPEKISVGNAELNELGNALVQRLHGYDSIVKKLTFEKEFLLGKIKEVSPETFEAITKPMEEKKD